MTQPDDRELEQYLKGDSKLSRRYRDASGETSPPDLDEAILAQARAELRRKPNLNRLLAPVALAASLVIGVNLAWNVYQAAPAPGEEAPMVAEKSRDDYAFVPEPPAAEPLARAEAPAAAPAPERKKARAAAPAPVPQEAERDAGLAAQEQGRERQDKEEQRVMASERSADSLAYEAPAAQKSAGAAAPAAALAPSALADAAPLSEAEKIDRLIDYVRTLPGAVFIRNGTEYGPAEAAKHLQLKREKAGSRVKTADDFIRLCASHSSMSGDAYLIRLEDGRTRTAEDVLREKLATLR